MRLITCHFYDFSTNIECLVVGPSSLHYYYISRNFADNVTLLRFYLAYAKLLSRNIDSLLFTTPFAIVSYNTHVVKH